MTRIDAHHHLWDTAVRDYPWMDGPWADPLRGRFDLPRYAALAGDAGSVAVQALHDVAETAELLAVAERPGPVIGVVGWADLTDPGVGDALAALRSGPGGRRLAGIRHQAEGEPDPRWLLRDDVLRGLRAVRDAGLAYDVLVRSAAWPRQADAALELARRLPGLPLVLDHAGKPDIAGGVWEPWSSWIAALAALPDVTVKLSGLVTEAGPDWRPADVLPYARHVLAAFGPRRVMYGSDWPVCLLAAEHDGVGALAEEACAELTPDERAAVFGGTARRVYGLDRPSSSSV